MRDIPHFVNGQSLIGTSGRFGDVFNPSTGEIQARGQFATDAEMDLAVRAAAKAQIGWASTNPQR
ncbi:MAG: aldehyde dehydrogenase family protein, partial [Caulobacteraceae bacterium]|nr:aldehyde dehydrogenase family protein [Caulobacteraceae bacterium]